jgi:hypothetical protein
MYFSPPITRMSTDRAVFMREDPWLINYTSEMYLSGYVATPARLLSSRRIEKHKGGNSNDQKSIQSLDIS